MKRVAAVMWCVMMMVAAVCPRLRAGDLDPTNAPGPTMHTLEEIYQRVILIPTNGGSVTVSAAVPKTGQESSYQTGDDGDYEKGVAWPSPRFTAGTGASSNCVTDSLTGLMWLKNPDATSRTWSNAIVYCEGLDGSAGRGGNTDWRLPNRFELESLLDLGQYNPALPPGHPFLGVQSSHYWSSTTRAGLTSYAWRVYLSSGYVTSDAKTNSRYVWPVRGGE